MSLTLNVAGLIYGVVRLIEGAEGATTTILINLAWTVYNLIITSASVAVASETRQVRSEPRVAAALPMRLTRADGTVIEGVTQDFRKGLGFRRLPEGIEIPRASGYRFRRSAINS